MQITLTSQTVRTSLAAVALHASKDETRPHLACVLIDQKEGLTIGAETTHIVASSGHTLARMKVLTHVLSDGDTSRPFGAPRVSAYRVALPIGLVKELIAHAKKNKEALYSITDKTVVSSGTSWTYDSKPEAFPPYERVIPAFRTDPAPFFCIASEYAALVGKTFETAYKGKGSAFFGMNSGGELEPILCVSNAVPDLTVVVMPVRGDITEWANEVKLSKTGRAA